MRLTVETLRRSFARSPTRIAVTYAAFGVLWIVSTDWVVFSLVDDPRLVVRIQTVKGWLFVGVSAVVIYGLVVGEQRELEAANERLDTALQQTSILHRILRHNLRNACTVIRGNAEIAAAHASGRTEASLNAIEAQNEQLVALSEKSKRLRDIVLGDAVPMATVELIEAIEARIEALEASYPTADIELDEGSPSELRIETDPRIGEAIGELLMNAVEHNDAERPTVRVSVTTTDDDVWIDIADDGPGTPEMERAVLEEGTEAPMFHSQGLGLWIAKATADRSGGDLTLIDNDPRGTIARFSLPVAPDRD
jgi:signal transduction histidine kinase